MMVLQVIGAFIIPLHKIFCATKKNLLFYFFVKFMEKFKRL